MTFTPDPHTPYQWQNAPATATPLDETHLEAAEADLVAYAQAVATAAYNQALTDAAATVQGAGGNLGATQTINFASIKQTIWLPGTLNANLTITFTNRVAGCYAMLLLTQDATGSRTLTISDGTSTSAVPITPTASSFTAVQVYCPNTTDIDATL